MKKIIVWSVKILIIVVLCIVTSEIAKRSAENFRTFLLIFLGYLSCMIIYFEDIVLKRMKEWR